MVAPVAPPIKAPLPVLFGRPSGATHPASKLTNPVKVKILTNVAFMVFFGLAMRQINSDLYLTR
jgi:hypothetical protein